MEILAKQIFVGRTKELKQFQELIAPENTIGGGLFIVGEGGSGKTLLLTKMMGVAEETKNILVAKNIIDLRSSENRHVEGLIQSIIRNFIFSGECFEKFKKAETEFYQVGEEAKNDPNFPAETIAAKRQAMLRSFDECLIYLATDKKVVIAFDTFEDIQGSNDEIQNWVLHHPAINKAQLILLVAGRKSLPITYVDHYFNELNLTGFNDLNDILDLYEKYYFGEDPNRDQDHVLFVDSLRNDKKHQQLVQALRDKTKGNPLMLGLSVYWIKNYRDFENEEKGPFTETEVVNLTDEQFEEQLSHLFLPFKLPGLAGRNEFEETNRRILVFMSYLHRRINKSLLEMLFQEKFLQPKDIEKVWDSLNKKEPEFFYIKNRTDGEIQLHDKLADLLRKYCLAKVFDDTDEDQISISLNKLADATITWYDSEINGAIQSKDNVLGKVDLLRAEKMSYLFRRDILVDLYQTKKSGGYLGDLNKIKNALGVKYDQILRTLRDYRRVNIRSRTLTSLLLIDFQKDLIESEFSVAQQYEIYLAFSELSAETYIYSSAQVFSSYCLEIADSLDDINKMIAARRSLHRFIRDDDNRDSKDNQNALELILDAKGLCHQPGVRESKLADITHLTGLFYSRRGEYTNAIKEYESARELCRTNGLENILSRVLNDCGFAYLRIGDYEKAKLYIHDAEKIRQDRVNSIELRLKNDNITDEELEQSENEKASASFMIGTSFMNLGHLARYSGRIIDSIESYDDALSIFNEIKKYDWQAAAFYSRGEAHRRRAMEEFRAGHNVQSKRFDKAAEQDIKDGIRICEKYEFTSSLDTAFRRLGRLYHDRAFRAVQPNKKLKLLNQAFRQFEKALAIAINTIDALEELECLTEIAYLADDRLKAIKETFPKRWDNEIKIAYTMLEKLEYGLIKYAPKDGVSLVYQYPVFENLYLLEKAAINFEQDNLNVALDQYIKGYTGLAVDPGYGSARYYQYLDHLRENIRRITDEKLRVKWCDAFIDRWTTTQVDETHPRYPATLAQIHGDLITLMKYLK